jgi:heat shock protein HtpX
MRIAFDEVRNNSLRSYALIIIFIILIGALGAAIGLFYNNTYVGLSLAVIFSIIYSLVGYYSGDKMILSMSKAKPVTKKEYPYLFHTVEGLAIAAGIPTPKTYVIEDSALNAFATGRDPKHASIAVTTGLLEKLNREELEGVVAHEMSHVKSFDIKFMMLVAVLVGIVTLLSDFLLRSFLWGKKSDSDSRNSQAGIIFIVLGLVLAILTPLIGELTRLAISRKREYMADANGAILTRYPPGLANALRKISKDPDPLVDNANRATSHLFISTPFRKTKGFVTNLFSTHPPIQDRIKRLEQM